MKISELMSDLELRLQAQGDIEVRVGEDGPHSAIRRIGMYSDFKFPEPSAIAIIVVSDIHDNY